MWAVASELVPRRDSGELRGWAELLVERAREDGVALTGEGGLLTELMRHVLQTGLEVEMVEHLGYEAHERGKRVGANARNGYYDKTVTTEIGEVELRVPRDRDGRFEPATVPKYQRRLDGLSGNVISLYAKGLTTGEIVDEMVAWQNRPLDPLYAVLVIDCLVIKVRGSQVANRPVYVAIGVNLDGERDLLGMWLGPTGGEGAKQWATMLTELKNRGVQDALIVCCDGLKGLPESIRTTWPQATVQTCVVHMVSNSLRYAGRQHWQRITGQMREIYTAPTVEAAEARFAEFAGEWADTYPAMINAWEHSWPEFVPFLEFPVELRKVVYTTDEIVKCEWSGVGVASERPSLRRRVRSARRVLVPDRVAA